MLMNTYPKSDVTFTRGDGSFVYSDKGEVYLDFTSGIGVNSLGYNNPTITKALVSGASLMHLSNLYDTAQDRNLAQLLIAKMGLKSVFFANSGAEANEGAIKLARKYSYDKYGQGRHEIITLRNSFHGRTITTLSATGQDKFHKYFTPFTDGFSYVPANDIEALLQAATDRTCAIMIELVQGEGGVLPLDRKYVKELAEFCRNEDVLLIVDEVQTGVGRCATFCAYEQYGILPDIVTLAKGLGGGIPIGAIVSGAKCEFTFGVGDHGSTFGGNPLACRVASAVVGTMEKSFLEGIYDKGDYIVKTLKQMHSPHIKEVRGLGLMIGIELSDLSAIDVRARCQDNNLLVLTAGTNTIRLLPPLTISLSEIREGLAILQQII
ncbi:aspartate aminotransferase family protein [Candidatus Epulonipiscium viviparus]|uniref:aspartate aminotransferase family protein n=1 Tax=Candidatus Epulonipiscium viviparus TaxID=420336 RepID=UPI00273811D3|nr:aspartate aminotransferase family protein [Candidatus Epulopiscium viviparus]